MLLIRQVVWLAVLLPVGASAQATDARCLQCHSKPSLARVNDQGEVASLFVDPEQYRASVHRDLHCVDCHKDLRTVQNYPHAPSLEPVHCADCHAAESQQMAVSTHWQMNLPGRSGKMSCSTCHGTHSILPHTDPESRTNRKNIATVCLGCHADQEIIPGSGVKVSAYEYSVHGLRLFVEGDTSAAECVDCHGNHRVLPADNPASPVNKPRIPQTCGRCHKDVLANYEHSIHGVAAANGVSEAPVCTDCHGEHTIRAPHIAQSSVSRSKIPETCGKCHESVQLTKKFGIASDRYSTYEDSYHGVANQYGRTIVANCASCHGHHDILPPSDPASSVNPANLVATCGKCHPNAGENFTRGKVHVKATLSNSPGVFFVRKFYYIFIGSLMIVFIAYIFVEYRGYLRRKSSQIKKQ